jgi:signal transduction histidine kinase
MRVHNITVQLDLSPDPLMVVGHRIQLEQVFVNLLTNARDAVQHAERKVISLSSRTAGTTIEVQVSDTGVGMSVELLPRIFDPFFTTKPTGQGTCLGLSISYGILKEHHGEIDVKSRIGEGTTFIIRVPIRSESDGPNLSTKEK